MSKHLHTSFFVIGSLFLLHQLVQKYFEIKLPLMDSYFDPFCFIALSLPLVQLERKVIFKQEKLSKVEAFFIFLILAILSEFLLPMLFVDFIYDPLDFLGMFLGFLFFLGFQNSLPKKHLNKRVKKLKPHAA